MGSTLNITIGNALEFYNFMDIPKKSIDLCIFDPPFFAEKKTFKSRSVNNIPEMEWINEKYVSNMSLTFFYLREYMKDEGWVAFKCDDRTSAVLYPELVKQGYILNRDVVWDKIKIGMGSYIRQQHETISCWRMTNKKSYFMYPAWRRDDETIKIRDKIHGNVGDINHRDRKGWHGGSKGLSFPSVIRLLPLGQGIKGQSKNHDHLCKTPISLWDPFLRWLCPHNGTVFDPFAGTGSIGKACIGLKDVFNNDKTVNYSGIEIDPQYSEKWTYTVEEIIQTKIDERKKTVQVLENIAKREREKLNKYLECSS